MRDVYGDRGTSVLTWIISASIGSFILQSIFSLLLHTEILKGYMALSSASLHVGAVWTFFSYSFFHETTPNGFLVLIIDLLGLYFLGRELLNLMGSRHFVGLYAGAVLLGGLAWAAAHFQGGGDALLGASPVLCGLLVFYALLYPDQRMTFLLFLFLPVTLKPKHIAWFIAALDLYGFSFYEVLGHASPLGMYHSAHLGGMLAGLLYYRFVHQRTEWDGPAKAVIELPKWIKRAPKSSATTDASYRVNLSNRDNLRAEVDRILDKINSSGFGALTPEEKRLLDEAKDLLSRH